MNWSGMVGVGRAVQLTIGLVLLLGSSAIASEVQELEVYGDQPATTVDEWLTQIAQASIVQITDVQLDSAEDAIGLTLQTTAELAAPTISIVGNALIANIPNAVLALPDGDEFSIEQPIAGIALVNVTNLPNNRVRIAITGTEAPPTAEVRADASGLTFSVTPGAVTAEINDDAIEIVVTGEEGSDYFEPNANITTRIDTPLLDTPASIQVIPQQVLEDQQVLDIDEALNNVSGVLSNSAEGRGYNTITRGFATEQVFIDGFRPDIDVPLETANLEQIDVLRGPASILFGDIQPGGIINLVTEQPLDEPFYELQLQAGSFGLIRPQIDFSGPLTNDGRLLYRLNALYSREDGFRDFDTDYERFFVAPVIAWEIGDRTNLSISLDYLHDEQPFDPGLLAFGNGLIDTPRDRIFGEADDNLEAEFLNLGYTLEHQFSDNWQIRNAFRYIDQFNSIQVALPLSLDEATGILSRGWAEQEININYYGLQTNVRGEFNTGSIAHTLVAGVDLSRQENDTGTFVDFVAPIPLNVFDPDYGLFERPDRADLPDSFPFEVHVNRLGVYIQDQIAFSEDLLILAGLRYDTVESRNLIQDTTDNTDAFSPRIGVVYQPAENVSLYGSYSQSFEPSLSRDIDGNLLEPELGEGFEVGVKTEWLDGNLFASLAYFNITEQNVATADPSDPFASVATGEQRSRGIEFDVRGEISPGWNLLASYSYTEAEVTEDNAIPIGNRLPGAAQNSFSLWTTYEVQSGDLEGLGLGVGLNYVGERQGDLENTFELDDYLLTNAAVFYRRDDWRFALNFKNIFDVEYVPGRPISRTRGIEAGQPFTIVGSISVQF